MNLSPKPTCPEDLTHSQWCMQVAAQSSAVPCDCGAEDQEAERVALVLDALRWRAMRDHFIAVDWAWNSPPLSVAIFELSKLQFSVRAGPTGADDIADNWQPLREDSPK